jgi:hypothetical protein
MMHHTSSSAGILVAVLTAIAMSLLAVYYAVRKRPRA